MVRIYLLIYLTAILLLTVESNEINQTIFLNSTSGLSETEVTCLAYSTSCQSCYVSCLKNNNVLPPEIQNCMLKQSYYKIDYDSMSSNRNEVQIIFLTSSNSNLESICTLKSLLVVKNTDEYNKDVKFTLEGMTYPGNEETTKPNLVDTDFELSQINSLSISNLNFNNTEQSLYQNLMLSSIEFTSIINVDFENKRLAYGNGAAIFADNVSNIVIDRCVFARNYVSGYISAYGNGGSLFFTGCSEISLKNSEFIKNTAEGQGGAIYIEYFSTIQEANNLSFIENIAFAGGAIMAEINTVLSNLEDISFIENEAKENGGAIHLEDESTILNSENLTFTGNKAESLGGAIFALKNCSIENINNIIFDTNEAILNGGAIYLEFESELMNSSSLTFMSNAAEEESGGAIFARNDCTINSNSDTIFENNYAEANGGAIFVEEYTEISQIFNVLFTKNNANQSGGALALQKCSSLFRIKNFTFDENQAISNEGGAIYAIDETKIEYFELGEFSNNYAKINGGALFVLNESQIDFFEEINFTNNEGNSGSAILIIKSSLQNFNLIEFIGNTGSAIYAEYAFVNNLTEINFLKNTGSSIYAYESEIANIFNCNFTHNEGAAISVINIISTGIFLNISRIYCSQNDLGCFTFERLNKVLVEYSTFTDILFGNVINSWESNTILEHNNFVNNIGLKKAAIIIDGVSQKYTNISYCKFINNTVQLSNTLQSDVTDFLSIDNEGSEAGAIFITNTKTFILYSDFINNTANIGGAISSYTSVLYIEGCNFTNNRALYLDAECPGIGGALRVKAYYDESDKNFLLSESELRIPLLIQECNFVNNSASGGGAVWAEAIDTEIEDSNFISNKAECEIPENFGVGGALENTGGLWIENTLFEQNIASYSSGAIDEQSGETIIERCIFIENFAGYYAGCLNKYSDEPVSLILDSLFEGNTALNAGCLYLEKVEIEIENSVFLNNEAEGSDLVNHWGGGAILLIDSEIVECANCSFINNTSPRIGGGILLSNARIINCTDCYFEGNRAASGSAICMQSSTINQCLDCYFTKNEAIEGGGGVISLSESQLFLCEDCKLTNNNASNGGAIFIYNSCYVNLTNCILSHNQALEEGGAIYEYYNNSFLFIINCTIKNSSADYGGAIYSGSNVTISIENSELYNNKASFEGGAIYLIEKALLFSNENTVVSSNSAELGGGIYVEQNCKLLILSTILKNNTAEKQGGGIYIYSDSELQIGENSEISENSAENGGGIYAESDVSIKLQDSELNNNIATNYGAALYIFRSSKLENSNNISFENNICLIGCGIFAQREVLIECDNCNFIANEAKESGAGIYVYDNSEIISCKNCLFEYNNAFEYGGGIFLQVSSNLEEIEFIENSAKISGGALMIVEANSNDENLHIQGCEFIENSAFASGGAIQFENELRNNNNLTVFNSIFIDNYVKDGDGGALFLEQPIVSNFTSNTFTNNSAKRGGALYNKIIGTEYTKNDPREIIKSYYIIETVYMFENNFTANRAKEVGGAVVLDYSSANTYAVGEIGTTLWLDTLEEIFSPSIANNSFEENEAKFAGAAFRLEGLNESSKDSCSKIEKILTENNEFKNNTSWYIEYYGDTGQSDILCNCIYGEYFSMQPSNLAFLCQVCQYGLYNFENEGGYETKCIPCAEGLNCLGGYNSLEIEQGYWEKQNELQSIGRKQSDIAYKCDTVRYYKEGDIETSICVESEKCDYNCPETDQIYNQLNGKFCCTDESNCLRGYRGPLCLACDEEIYYFEENNFYCSRCAPTWQISFKIMATLILLSFLAYLAVYGLENTIENEICNRVLRLCFNNFSNLTVLSTPLMKILTNYLENIFLIEQLKFSLPSAAKELLDQYGSIGSPLEALTSNIECIVSRYFSNSNLTVKQTLLIAEFAEQFIIITIALSIMLSINFYKRYEEIEKNELYTIPLTKNLTTIVIYFFFYFETELINSTFEQISCTYIAGDKYEESDIYYECNQMVSSSANLSVAIPILLVELLVPGIVLLIFIIGKEKPEYNKESRDQLLYLSKGYSDSCYYWEFVRMGQRIFIIFSFVYFKDYNNIKAVMALFGIIGYYILTEVKEPNENIQVSQIDIASGITELLTILLALFLYGNDFASLEYIGLIMMIIINFLFLYNIVKKITAIYYYQLMFTILKFEKCERREFVKEFVQKMEIRKVAISKWKNIRLIVSNMQNVKKDIEIEFEEQFKEMYVISSEERSKSNKSSKFQTEEEYDDLENFEHELSLLENDHLNSASKIEHKNILIN